jgi:hypothetical protein
VQQFAIEAIVVAAPVIGHKKQQLRFRKILNFHPIIWSKKIGNFIDAL